MTSSENHPAPLTEAEAMAALRDIHGWMGRASCYRLLSGPAAIAGPEMAWPRASTSGGELAAFPGRQ